MNTKTEIEIEFSETIVYSRPGDRFEAFCTSCETLVEMAAPQVAAIIAHLTEREIYRLVETNNVHFVETDRVVICLRSLTERLSEAPTAAAELAGEPKRKNGVRL